MSELYSSRRDQNWPGKREPSKERLTKAEAKKDKSLYKPAVEQPIDDKALSRAACGCPSCAREVTEIARLKIGNRNEVEPKRVNTPFGSSIINVGATTEDLVNKAAKEYHIQASKEEPYRRELRRELRLWNGNKKGKGKGIT